MDFVVERKTWIRGDGGEMSRLLRSDGKRCCIGFVCFQAGVEDRLLRNMGYVCELPSSVTQSRPAIATVDGEDIEPAWIREAYKVNDDEMIPDADRELKLQAIAASAGHSLRFVDSFELPAPRAEQAREAS